ncbi:MAG: OmpA family protein [Bacteroidetes bacterium]|nr:OmpA family protein [Bacteroidota bacterium]
MIIGMVVPSEAFAQKKRTQIADQAFTDQHYFTALDRYKKAFSKVKKDKSEKSRIAFQIAECYRFINDSKKAEAAYQRAIRLKYQRKEPLTYLYLADAMKANGKYEDAIVEYNNYTEKVPEDPRGQQGATSCRLAMSWDTIPSKYKVEPIPKINTKADDFSPCFADKFYSSIIFTSTRDGSTGKEFDEWTGQKFSDLWYTKVDKKNTWSAPVLIEKEGKINSRANEGVATFNSTFSQMYFTRCEYVEGLNKECQIFISASKGKSYATPKWLNIGLDTTITVGHPTLSNDELMIIFASDREGGLGGKDLWMATREKAEDDFDRPVNLGPKINTSGDEMFPFLRSDTVLYFASNRLMGMGGLDIFKSSYKDDEWSTPENLKSPINSNSDDFGMVFRPDQESGFFSSNRKGGRGGDDIYAFEVPPVIFKISGVVKDELSLLYIEGVKVKMVGTDGSSVEAKTDPKGFYNFSETQIKQNTTYEIFVSKEGYFNTSGKITTVGLEGSKDFTQDFMLQHIPSEPIILPEIRYDLAKWDLKPQYQDSLQGLIKTLDLNPTIVIELAAHTDTRNTYEYNDVLSQKRAESVVNYLIERGIDPDRLVARGYGERVPRLLVKDITVNGYTFKAGTILTETYIDSLPTVDEREAAHSLNRRTEFRVLRNDFIPKTTIEEIAPTAKVDVVVNPQEDVVKYHAGTGEAIIASCIINGYSMDFTYIPSTKGLNVSLTFALKMLKDGNITKNDFEGDVTKILAGGTIVDRAAFYIKEIRIGNKTVNDLAATVIYNQETPLLFGENTLKMFGKFKIDKEKSEIVFE